MSAKAFFLITVSLLVALTASKERFFPNKRFQNVRTPECSSQLLRRNLQAENSDQNNANQQSSNAPPEIVTVRLQGDTDLGYYYVTLYFGTPLQKQTLIVDTGSVTTTVPCIECGDNCGKDHFDKPFDHNLSSTFKELECMEGFGNWACTDCTMKCRFSVGYVEGSSYTGHFTKDYVVFGNEIEDYFTRLNSQNQTVASHPSGGDNNNTTENKEKAFVDEIIQRRRLYMPFGCTDKETKLFYTQEADGIFGLGVTTNSRSNPPNVLDALELVNSAASREFSLCLAPSGGYFTLGGHNTEHHLANHSITYTDYHDEYGQYRVKLNKIEIEGEDLGLDEETLNKGDGAFFDSGTTLTHVPGTTYNAIRESLKRFCNKDRKHCGATGAFNTYLCWSWDSSKLSTLEDFLATFPSFTWYFGDDGEGEYDWKPEDYLYLKRGTEYCMGLSRYERESILGGTFMKNHDVLFDKANKRIGFVRANCSAVNEITIPPFETPVENPPPVEKIPAENPPVENPSAENPPVENPPAENPDTSTITPVQNPDITTTPVENPATTTTISPNQAEPISVADKPQQYNLLVILAGIAGLIVIGSLILLGIKSIRKIRYSSMQNEPELPSSKGFHLPSHINDASAAQTNTDRSQDEDISNAHPSKYQV